MRFLAHRLLFLCLLACSTLLGGAPAAADEDWVITSFDAQIAIQSDGALRIVETILVDFGSLKRHGIFRDIPVRYDYDEERNRVYQLAVESVTDRDGKRIPYETSSTGAMRRIKIGDADVEVTGRQSYRITYTVRHALNGFADHDELYWNVNGDAWPVRTERVAATVTLPGGDISRLTCFVGARGSTDPCQVQSGARSATFATTRPLAVGEQLTIVVAFPRGVVPDPQPRLEEKPRDFEEFFETTPTILIGSASLLGIVVVGLGGAWWRFGRDRRYTSMYYLTDDPREETRPLLSSDPIVIEYQPPAELRPAHMGLLLDESADKLDATATIVDLAARGYLTIAEVADDGVIGRLLGKKDWRLASTGKSIDDLLKYERLIYDGLFAGEDPVLLFDLKNRFYTHLNKAQESLYRDAMRQQWFAFRPDRARAFWLVAGIVVLVVGVAGVFVLGALFGAALIAFPLILAGLMMALLSNWMPKRTARGRELLRRTLGFRQYLATAETSRHEFNEQQNIFAAYLPYAIVFNCVDKWARAFRDIDVQAATRGWYAGQQAFSAGTFSRNLHGFADDVSSTIVSTPGGSGSSGFSSGGGAGGGGGGGGGGSW